MDSLELPALRDILAGSVFIFNNQNLCHIQSINWDEIITGKNKKLIFWNISANPIERKVAITQKRKSFNTKIETEKSMRK